MELGFKIICAISLGSGLLIAFLGIFEFYKMNAHGCSSLVNNGQDLIIHTSSPLLKHKDPMEVKSEGKEQRENNNNEEEDAQTCSRYILVWQIVSATAMIIGYLQIASSIWVFLSMGSPSKMGPDYDYETCQFKVINSSVSKTCWIWIHLFLSVILLFSFSMVFAIGFYPKALLLCFVADFFIMNVLIWMGICFK